MNNTVIYVIAILVVELLGFIVGMLTRSGTTLYAETINKPRLSPPGILFPIAWTILYALMGVGVARVVISGSHSAAVTFFIIQLVLNFAWCFIFFKAQRFDLALVELIVMFVVVIIMTVLFYSADSVAALLQIPYIIWLCFATYLNIGVIKLNC